MSTEPRYTLTYFDIRGRAEPIRLLLHHLAIPFVDRGVSGEEWKSLKPDSPLGQLPYLVDHERGRVIPQSMAILRHLARVHGAEGATEDERLDADLAGETAVDARNALSALRFSPAFKDEAAREKYVQETAPIHFGRLERLLGDRPWFAAARPLWCDLLVYDALERHEYIWPGCLHGRPTLEAFVARVEALPSLADYLPRRRA